jgi:hypothetical protein
MVDFGSWLWLRHARASGDELSVLPKLAFSPEKFENKSYKQR